MKQIKIIGKKDHNCHGNALKNKKRFGLKIFKGLLSNKKDNTMTPHFWNIHRGRIFDKSVGYDENSEYFGKEVTKEYTDSDEMYEKELDGINIQMLFGMSSDKGIGDIIEVNKFKKM